MGLVPSAVTPSQIADPPRRTGRGVPWLVLVGYLAGALAGAGIARVSVAFGWQGVFVGLAAVSALAALGAGTLYVLGARAAASKSHLP